MPVKWLTDIYLHLGLGCYFSSFLFFSILHKLRPRQQSLIIPICDVEGNYWGTFNETSQQVWLKHILIISISKWKSVITHCLILMSLTSHIFVDTCWCVSHLTHRYVCSTTTGPCIERKMMMIVFLWCEHDSRLSKQRQKLCLKVCEHLQMEVILMIWRIQRDRWVCTSSQT